MTTQRMKEKLTSAVAKVGAFGALAVARANYMVYSTDAFAATETAVKSLQGKLISLAKVLFPLAIVICAVSMFFTRDQKKFDMEKRILIGCCLAYALIYLVVNGNIIGTIEGLFSGGGAS